MICFFEKSKNRKIPTISNIQKFNIIAVMFTFSFGSAFAATAQETFADSYSTAIGDQYFEQTWADLVKVTADSDTVNVVADATYAVDKTVLAGLKTEAKAVYDDYMEKTAEAYITTATDLANTVLKLNADTDVAKAKAFKVAVAAAQFAADKNDAISKLGTVPTYNYATTVMSEKAATAAEAAVTEDGKAKIAFVDKDYTYQKAAEKLVEYYKGLVEDEDDFNADVTVKSYKDASDQVKTVITKAVVPMGYAANNVVALTGAYDLKVAYDANAIVSGKTADNESVTYVDVNNSVNNWSAKAVDADTKTDAATVAAVKAMNAAKYAKYVVGADSAKIAYADKWLKIADILAEEGYTYDNESKKIQGPDGSLYGTKAEYVTELEEYAAKWGAEKNAEGQLVRDAAVVQKYLEKGRVAIATAQSTEDGKKFCDDYKAKIYAAKSEVIANLLAFEKDSAKKAAELIVSTAETKKTYFDAELAKVKKYVETYTAKIDAADKVTDVEATYEELLAKVADVKTADALKNEWTAAMDANGDSAAKNIYTAAANYVTYYNANNGDASDLNAATLKDRIADMIGKSGVRTATEIKALKEEAVKVAQGLPTADAVKAAKKSLEKAIAALPAKATVADFASVQAVSDALDAYKDVVGTNDVTLTAYQAAINQIIAEYNSQFAQQVAKVSKTDETAIKAILSDIAAAKKSIKGLTVETTPVLTYMDGLKSILEGYLDDIKTSEREAVEKAIKAIPVNVTDADKATVEAARKLYDAYVAKYTDLEALYDETNGTTVNAGGYTKGYAADDIAISALTAAETVLGLNAPTAADKVEALKITAKSTAKKGSITVSWTVKGDATAADGYRVYRSTKKNSGFGTKPLFTTTKQTYKNTKNLKKGTRYYYKVRAYKVVDGKTYFSDWSNKAIRKAK